MNVSKHCRLELGQDRIAGLFGAALIALAGLALSLSALSWGVAAVLLALVVAYVLYGLRALRRWRVLEIAEPNAVTLIDRRGNTVFGELRDFSVFGPLQVFEVELLAQRVRLPVWMPGLSMNQRRQLARVLARIPARLSQPGQPSV